MPDRRPLVVPPAARMNTRRIVGFGTVVFFVAFVVLLCCWGWLGRHDHRIWLWTSLAGWLLGLLAFPVMTRHRDLGRTL